METENASEAFENFYWSWASLENVYFLILLKENRPEREAQCVIPHQNLLVTPYFLHNKALLSYAKSAVS